MSVVNRIPSSFHNSIAHRRHATRVETDSDSVVAPHQLHQNVTMSTMPLASSAPRSPSPGVLTIASIPGIVLRHAHGVVTFL